jgi:hypothetical protein
VEGTTEGREWLCGVRTVTHALLDSVDFGAFNACFEP